MRVYIARIFNNNNFISATEGEYPYFLLLFQEIILCAYPVLNPSFHQGPLNQ